MELHEYLLDRYGKKLYQIAKKSSLQHKHSAIILDKRLDLICSGYNCYKNGRIEYSKKVWDSYHAEHVAIEKYLKVYKPRGRKAYLIFTGRANGSGMTYGKPCDECAEKILDCGLNFEYTRYQK